MAKFNVGDRVRYGLEDQGTVLTPARKKGGLVVVRFDDKTVNNIKEDELSPATDAKALRAKYKAAPSKRDMVLIGEWNAPESGPGTFYAPRSRRSQVERTFLAIEEGDESKEAFYSVINAGGVFIRD